MDGVYNLALLSKVSVDMLEQNEAVDTGESGAGDVNSDGTVVRDMTDTSNLVLLSMQTAQMTMVEEGQNNATDAGGSKVNSGTTINDNGVDTGVTASGSGVDSDFIVSGSGAESGVTASGSSVDSDTTVSGNGIDTGVTASGSDVDSDFTASGSGAESGVTTSGSSVNSGITTCGSDIHSGATAGHICRVCRLKIVDWLFEKDYRLRYRGECFRPQCQHCSKFFYRITFFFKHIANNFKRDMKRDLAFVSTWCIKSHKEQGSSFTVRGNDIDSGATGYFTCQNCGCMFKLWEYILNNWMGYCPNCMFHSLSVMMMDDN